MCVHSQKTAESSIKSQLRRIETKRFVKLFHYFPNIFLRKSLLIIDSAYATLKGQSCKLYDDKDMITSTQITNTEIFALILVLVFKLLSRKALFINRKDKRNCYKVGYFLRK